VFSTAQNTQRDSELKRSGEERRGEDRERRGEEREREREDREEKRRGREEIEVTWGRKRRVKRGESIQANNHTAK